jgi:hypothetical protein
MSFLERAFTQALGNHTCGFPFYDGLEETNGFLVGPRVVEDIIVGFARRLRSGCWRFVLVCGSWRSGLRYARTFLGRHVVVWSERS